MGGVNLSLVPKHIDFVDLASEGEVLVDNSNNLYMKRNNTLEPVKDIYSDYAFRHGTVAFFKTVSQPIKLNLSNIIDDKKNELEVNLNYTISLKIHITILGVYRLYDVRAIYRKNADNTISLIDTSIIRHTSGSYEVKFRKFNKDIFLTLLNMEDTEVVITRDTPNTQRILSFYNKPEYFKMEYIPNESDYPVIDVGVISGIDGGRYISKNYWYHDLISSSSWVIEPTGGFKMYIPQTLHKMTPTKYLGVQFLNGAGKNMFNSLISYHVSETGDVTLYSDIQTDGYIIVTDLVIGFNNVKYKDPYRGEFLSSDFVLNDVTGKYEYEIDSVTHNVDTGGYLPYIFIFDNNNKNVLVKYRYSSSYNSVKLEVDNPFDGHILIGTYRMDNRALVTDDGLRGFYMESWQLITDVTEYEGLGGWEYSSTSGMYEYYIFADANLYADTPFIICQAILTTEESFILNYGVEKGLDSSILITIYSDSPKAMQVVSCEGRLFTESLHGYVEYDINTNPVAPINGPFVKDFTPSSFSLIEGKYYLYIGNMEHERGETKYLVVHIYNEDVGESYNKYSVTSSGLITINTDTPFTGYLMISNLT